MDRYYILSLTSGEELNSIVTHEIMGYENNWSESIQAAWEVVEKFPFWKITLVKNRVDNRVYIEKEDGSGYFAKELPIPEAICKAALLAVLEATS
jgi:hypothetical protein